MRASVIACVLFSCISVSASADEQMDVIAQSGQWGAFAHRESMTSQPDVCAVANVASGLIFRMDGNDFEIRLVDKNWSLPTDVKGSINVAVGEWKQALDISSNTDKMVAVEVPQNEVERMFDSMDKASVMSITVGKEKARMISLSGSTKVTNAFRTCAGIQGSDDAQGGNPFK